MSEYETAPDIFCYPFDNVFEVRIPGSLHQLGTQALMITVLDTHNPPEPIWWALTDTGPVAPETYDVTLHFPKPETGVVHLRVMYL